MWVKEQFSSGKSEDCSWRCWWKYQVGWMSAFCMDSIGDEVRVWPWISLRMHWDWRLALAWWKCRFLERFCKFWLFQVWRVMVKYISELKEYSSSRAKFGLKKPKKGWCPVQPGSGVRSGSSWKQRRWEKLPWRLALVTLNRCEWGGTSWPLFRKILVWTQAPQCGKKGSVAGGHGGRDCCSYYVFWGLKIGSQGLASVICSRRVPASPVHSCTHVSTHSCKWIPSALCVSVCVCLPGGHGGGVEII